MLSKNQILSAYQEFSKSDVESVSGALDPRGLESPGPIFKALILSLVSFFQTVRQPLLIPTCCTGCSNWKEVAVSNFYQFSSVAQLFKMAISSAQSCPTLWDPMNCSTPGLPIHHQLPESTQTHVYRVSDAIQPSHPLSSPSPLAFNLSQHQGLFQWVSSSHQVAKVLEFQLQHQSFQWTPRTDLF